MPEQMPALLFDYNTLMQQMLATNADYLQMSVGIILLFISVSSAVFYFVGVKPFRDELKTTVEETKKLSDENVELAERNKAIEEKLRLAEEGASERFTEMEANYISELDKLAAKTRADFEALKKVHDDSLDELSNSQAEITKLLTEKTIELVNAKVEGVQSILDHKVTLNSALVNQTNSHLWERLGYPGSAVLYALSMLDDGENADHDVAKEAAFESLARIVSASPEALSDAVLGKALEYKLSENKVIAGFAATILETNGSKQK